MTRTEKPKLPFEVWALVAGAFTVALGYGVVAPAIPQFALEFNVSYFAASAIVSAFAGMRLISAPFAGWFVSKFGERRSYTVGILIVAISTGAAAFAQDYTQFVILRGAGGFGSTMFTVAATALLVKMSPANARGRVASMNAAGFLLGGLIGPVFGGIVSGFGLRAPFVFYFFMLIIAATVVAIALRNSQAAGSPVRDAPAAQSMPFAAALKVPQYRALLLSVFSFGWASFGVRVSIVPIYVAAVFHGDAAMAAWVLAAYAAGNAIFIFPAGRWTDTVGRKPLLIIGLCVLALTYVAFPLAPNLVLAMLVMLISGMGSALANPAQQAVLADVLNSRSGGGVVAGYSMATDLGGVLGPLVAGAIVDFAGFGWAFGVTAMLLAVAMIGWTLASELHHRGPAAARG